MDLNEFQTRLQKIDVFLKEQGWDVGDRSKVITEVDTKQSDFTTQDYKRVSDTLRNDLESKYVDYLLLDSQGYPIAILEAKRTSKDPLITARKQAEDYADDIKAQTGKDVFIFLSNGYESWFYDRERYGPRMVKGFFTQGSLERMKFQIENRKPLTDIEVNTNIVDRPRSIENVKRVLEHLDKGHRKGLIVMATGTGKTRVAMAIIDALMKKNWVQKVLFLADRRALRKQAFTDGYKVFFPEEPRSKILSGNFQRDKNLYVSTIQTFMECYNQKDSSGKFLISPGEFDLIISDEAHRSIYNKWKEVFTYLDAIQIGLTATPSDMIDRDTFRFFGCGMTMPTALYDYGDAVRDGVLCDFRKHVLGAQTYFQVKGVRTEDLSPAQRRELLEKGIDPDDVDFEGTDIEKKVVVIGTNEAIVREFMEGCLMDKTGTLPAKTIFFALTKKHAKRLWEAFEKLYPEYKGQLARVIVSDAGKDAQSLIDDFKKKNLPRIAISVDMLDTGIDVPEVCNLVFAKPVFSKIKFWQMIGRGTRADNACKQRDWLPDGKKEYFKIFDFWKNFKFFEMKVDGDARQSSEAITTRIFLIQIGQLKQLEISGDVVHWQAVRKRILDDISKLPKDSVMIREKLADVETALSPSLWDNVGLDPVEFLKRKVAPLMRYKQGVNLPVASFSLKVEKLGLALLTGNENEVERQKKGIAEMLNCLPRTLDIVKEKEELLDKVLSTKFWNELSYKDCQLLLHEFAELMRYKMSEPRPQIILDLDDFVKERGTIQFGPDSQEEYVHVYKEKVEKKIKELAQAHPTIQKIRADAVLTEDDLEELEEVLNRPELFITEDVLRRAYGQGRGTLVQFIKKILGLYQFPDSKEKIKEAIKEAFQTYIIENNRQYSADQLNFIRTIQTVFARKKHIEMVDFYEAPFTNFGISAPMPMFAEDELKDFVDLCERMESELFVGGV